MESKSDVPAAISFRNEPRRRFSAEYKHQIVETVLASPLSLARVARENELNHNQLARWRREYERGAFAPQALSDKGLVPVEVKVSPAPPVQPLNRSTAYVIEVRLAKGQLVVHGDDALLTRLIEALR